MNDRIKELAEQAKQYAREQMAHPLNPMIFSADVFQEKFAELIVKECTNIVADAVDHREPASIYVYKIKRHFGVK